MIVLLPSSTEQAVPNDQPDLLKLIPQEKHEACGGFGANAARYRLNVLTYNVLSAPRRLVLPKELKKARPKGLRFHLFCVAPELIHHACKPIVRLARRWLVKPLTELAVLRRRILSLAQP